MVSIEFDSRLAHQHKLTSFLMRTCQLFLSTRVLRSLSENMNNLGHDGYTKLSCLFYTELNTKAVINQ